MDDELSDLVASLLVPTGLELVDLELRSSLGAGHRGPGRGGRPRRHRRGHPRRLGGARRARPVRRARYTLEVSSPGVERRLRTPAHFERAVGET